ncbi:MAG: hemerythrin domain-containing protein [Myxococcales bacterium]|nr:hemerythrin domain-containing protein [Myxococcales bacterium]MCC6898453.1 hemerythrin domain-containing protein [Polyangiaceae bacterium]
MPEPALLPSLFGRATAFLEEHRNLRETLGRLQSYCILLGQAEVAPELDPQHLLEHLCRLMVDHFAGEEADDYFGTFRREAPWLKERLQRLEEEHWEIVEVIGELQRVAQSTHRRDELVDGLARLLERVDAHERAEANLVHGFFLGSAEAGEVPSVAV